MRNLIFFFIVTSYFLINECFCSNTIEEVFTDIYENSKWGLDRDCNGNGSSGGGSLLCYAQTYVDFLQLFLKENNIKSVVDFGCGDWSFSQYINWQGISYFGYDVVKSVIEKNNKKWGGEFCNFVHADANRIDLQAADLLICKDVLQHLSNSEITKFLKQCKKFKYCLITNDVDFYTETASNIDIQTGEWRYIDLTKQPFEIKGITVLQYISMERKKKVLLIAENLSEKLT